jgi:hypothetical protein
MRRSARPSRVSRLRWTGSVAIPRGHLGLDHTPIAEPNDGSSSSLSTTRFSTVCDSTLRSSMLAKTPVSASMPRAQTLGERVGYHVFHRPGRIERLQRIAKAAHDGGKASRCLLALIRDCNAGDFG